MSFTVQFSIVIPHTGKKKANIRRCASKCLKINVNYFSSTISNLRAWVDRLCHLLGYPTPRIIYEWRERMGDGLGTALNVAFSWSNSGSSARSRFP